MTEEYREEVVRPTGQRVVRTTETVVDPNARTVEVREDPMIVEQPARRVVRRRWWRRYAPEPAVTEVYAAPTYSYDPALAQFLRVMWFALGLLMSLLALRFLLALFGANPVNPFAALIYGITGVFVAPFRTLFPVPAIGGSVFEGYTLIAMLVYFLVWWAIVKLVGVVANRPVDV